MSDSRTFAVPAASRTFAVPAASRTFAVPAASRLMLVNGPYPQRTSTTFAEAAAVPTDAVSISPLLSSAEVASAFDAIVAPLIHAPESADTLADTTALDSAVAVAETTDTVDATALSLHLDEPIDIGVESPTLITASLTESLSTPSTIDMPTGAQGFDVHIGTNDTAVTVDAVIAELDALSVEPVTVGTEGGSLLLAAGHDVTSASDMAALLAGAGYSDTVGTVADSTPTIQTTGLVFDTVGTGTTTGSAWTHNIGGNALLIAAVTANTNVGGSPVAGSASFAIGGTSIPLLDKRDFLVTTYQPGYGYEVATLWLFGLMNPPQGAQTITPTVTANHGWEANSLSYNGSSGFGTPVDAANAGPGTLTLPVTTAAAQMGVAALAGWRTSTTTTTTTTTTVRSMQTLTTGISTVVVDLILTDIPGGPDTAFTANGAGGANYTTLGAIALPVIAG